MNKQNAAGRDPRESILSAAISVFALRGYSSTRIRDVAREAGISYGLAYYYFQTKEELFHTVIDITLASSISIYKSVAMSGYASSYEKLRILAETFLDITMTKGGRNLSLLMVQAFSHSNVPPQTRALVSSRMVEYETCLITLFKQVQLHGYAIDKDPRVLATMFNAILEGYSVTCVSYPEVPKPNAELIISSILS